MTSRIGLQIERLADAPGEGTSLAPSLRETMDQRDVVRPGSGALPTGEQANSPVYRVALDVRGVRRREVGLDPTGEQRICYSLPLSGRVDDRWRRAFRLVQREETGYFRYRLEMASAAITFVCRESRSANELSEGIRQLAVLLDRVNREASKES